MVAKVGINGFGRIGRVIFRTFYQSSDIEVSAINDPAIDIEYICYLIKFDSTHGKFKEDVIPSANEIHISGNKIKVFREKLPSAIPWQSASVQYVIEASGMFTNMDKASGHLASKSVKRVIVTAPSIDIPMIILGVNEDNIRTENKVISCASSTLYCLAPIIKILEDNFGVAEGFITSIHAMTPSLKPLDGLCLRGKHWRDHRGIHQNIIPAATGACKALGKIIPQVKDKLGGLAFRVPIVNVSVLDITIRLKNDVSILDIIKCVERESKSRMRKIIKISHEQAVSSDFLGDENSCILDVNSSLQLTPNFFKLICWYENEYSYACRVADSILISEKQNSLELITKLNCMRQIISTYNIQNKHKIILSTSQDTVLRAKLPHRQIINKKPLQLQNSGSSLTDRQTFHDSKKKNESFRIWNDEDQVTKPTAVRQNKNSLFHSCMALGPSYLNHNNYLKTQKRLEEVKKEFSKMVNMTENLLRKSNEENFEINNSCMEENLETNEMIKDSSKDIDKMALNQFKTNNSDGMRGDYEARIIKTYNDVFKSRIKYVMDSNAEESKNESAKHIKPPNYNIANNQIKFTPNTVVLNHCEISEKCIALVNLNQQLKTNVSHELIQKTSQVLKSALCISIDESDESNKGSLINTENNHLNTNEFANINEAQNAYTIDSESTKNNVENYGVEKYALEDYCKDIDGKICDKKDININKPNKCLLNQVDVGKSNVTINSTDIEETDKQTTNRVKQIKNKIIEGIIKTLSTETAVTEEAVYTPSPVNTNTTISNGDRRRMIPDLYDKLDSASATDSDNSFQINERKSQIINITDLTHSVEDLARLDKICRIIEISDELSDQLFSALENNTEDFKRNQWSFKDLCERLKLDEFCNKVFGKL